MTINKLFLAINQVRVGIGARIRDRGGVTGNETSPTSTIKSNYIRLGKGKKKTTHRRSPLVTFSPNSPGSCASLIYGSCALLNHDCREKFLFNASRDPLKTVSYGRLDGTQRFNSRPRPRPRPKQINTKNFYDTPKKTRRRNLYRPIRSRVSARSASLTTFPRGE